MKTWGKLLLVSLLVFAVTTLFVSTSNASFVTADPINSDSVPGRT